VCYVKTTVLYSSGRVTCFGAGATELQDKKKTEQSAFRLTAFTKCELFSYNPKPVWH